MKYMKTFEAYVSYDKLKNWGSSPASMVEDELRTQIINLFIAGGAGISNYLNDVIYTDQSTDRGIKWQIEVQGKGTDVIHAYKDGKFKGQYEWYLNKKKSSKYDIQQYFLNKYVPKTEQYSALLKNFNRDKKNHRHFKSVDEYKAQAKKLADLYNSMSSKEQKVAHQRYIQLFKETIPFNEFKGY
jgi:hypothetical protein